MFTKENQHTLSLKKIIYLFAMPICFTPNTHTQTLLGTRICVGYKQVNIHTNQILCLY
jgi:hypothetical protein